MRGVFAGRNLRGVLAVCNCGCSMGVCAGVVCGCCCGCMWGCSRGGGVAGCMRGAIGGCIGVYWGALGVYSRCMCYEWNRKLTELGDPLRSGEKTSFVYKP